MIPFELSDIEKLFSEEICTYLKNKHCGGLNNEKGNSYEIYFTLYEVCKSAEIYFNNSIDTMFYR